MKHHQISNAQKERHLQNKNKPGQTEQGLGPLLNSWEIQLQRTKWMSHRQIIEIYDVELELRAISEVECNDIHTYYHVNQQHDCSHAY